MNTQLLARKPAADPKSPTQMPANIIPLFCPPNGTEKAQLPARAVGATPALGTSAPLTESERDFLARVAEFCRSEVAPHCEQWEEDEIIPREVFVRAGELGLLG